MDQDQIFQCELYLGEQHESFSDVTMLTIPGAEGNLGILKGHMPFVAELQAGTITITTGSGKKLFQITDGVATIDDRGARIIAASAN